MDGLKSPFNTAGLAGLTGLTGYKNNIINEKQKG